MKLLAVLAILLAFVPLSAAEPGSPSIAVNPTTGPLAPGDSTEVNFSVTFTCTPDEAPYNVTLGAQAQAAWASVAIAPAAWRVSAIECTTGAATFDGKLTIAAGENAPAYEWSGIEVEATIRAANATSSGTQSARVQAAYAPGLTLASNSARLEGKAGDIVGTKLTVNNTGNARVRVTFQLVDVPEGWNVAPPPSIILEPRLDGSSTDTTREVTLQAIVPTGKRTGEFIVRATATPIGHEADADAPQEIRIALAASGSSVPGAAPLALVGVALMIAALRRR